jgi:hypothetical protein
MKKGKVMKKTSNSKDRKRSGHALAGLLLVWTVAACGAATNEAEDATAFWSAMEAGDREAAIGYLDPAAAESGQANTFGRASTIDGQFDWYETVGWEWTLDACVENEGGGVECRAAAHNAWSDALGVEPVTGTFVLTVGDDGISGIVDESDSFISQWSPMVFEVFANWVAANHPEDAEIMFDFSVDANQQILDLYEVNTERFVEAQKSAQTRPSILCSPEVARLDRLDPDRLDVLHGDVQEVCLVL